MTFCVSRAKAMTRSLSPSTSEWDTHAPTRSGLAAYKLLLEEKGEDNGQGGLDLVSHERLLCRRVVA
jgi:hypothetical protein